MRERERKSARVCVCMQGCMHILWIRACVHARTCIPRHMRVHSCVHEHGGKFGLYKHTHAHVGMNSHPGACVCMHAYMSVRHIRGLIRSIQAYMHVGMNSRMCRHELYIGRQGVWARGAAWGSLASDMGEGGRPPRACKPSGARGRDAAGARGAPRSPGRGPPGRAGRPRPRSARGPPRYANSWPRAKLLGSVGGAAGAMDAHAVFTLCTRDSRASRRGGRHSSTSLTARASARCSALVPGF